MSTPTPRRQKIAILGGGIGAITTAWYLSRTPELRERFEITLYQMGWRLGGKLASGVDRDRGWRNEEHGLHVWFGFYDNAFASFRDCSAEMFRLYPNYRFPTYLDVFKPLSYTPIGNLAAGPDQYGFWHFHWPTNDGVPGEGGVWREPWAALVHFWEFLRQHCALFEGQPELPPDHPPLPEEHHGLFRHLVNLLHPGSPARASAPAPETSGIAAHLDRIHVAILALEGRHAQASPEHLEFIGWLLRELRAWILPLVAAHARQNPDAHVYLSTIDYAIAFLCGIFNPKYGILQDLDLSRIDHLDLREWLLENGGDPEIVRRASWIRAFYDTPFAYRDGDLDRPAYAAGAAARFAIRLCATYKGSPLYLGQAGFGSAIIAPYYQVLRDRGVKVKFFHKVKHLAVSPDGQEIQRVDLDVQALPADPSRDYDPVFWDDQARLFCWPNAPLWEQLRDGQALREAGVNFESHWCPHPPAARVSLQAGTDFDAVVLAISLGAFKTLNAEDPSMCAELFAANPRFRDMVDRQDLVATFAPQFWFVAPTRNLGWPTPVASVAAPEPNDVWADMSPLLDFERWPNLDHAPRALMYTCGPLSTRLYAAPVSDASVPAQAAALTRSVTSRWLQDYGTTVWPGTAAPGGDFDYAMLFDPRDVSGPDRLSAQFLRVNVDPTECCVTSFPGSIQHRLRGDQSGFRNLFLAGDWTNTTLNVTCVEATTISGMIAARAVSGDPLNIVGEHFLDGTDSAE